MLYRLWCSYLDVCIDLEKCATDLQWLFLRGEIMDSFPPTLHAYLCF